MRKWWVCSKGKFCEEYRALLRIVTSEGAGLIRVFAAFLKSPDISVVIRIARLQLAGHVARMDENCMPRRLMYVQLEGLRKVGRPRAGGEMKWERTQGCWDQGVGGQQP
jgi:hypothetical protein